jgi:hypothetical protein
MVLSIIVNAALDITFGVGWWVVKKVGSSVYDLGSNLFFEKNIKPTLSHIVDLEKDTTKMEKLMELLEHDLVEIKHNQEIILHKLEIDDVVDKVDVVDKDDVVDKVDVIDDVAKKE